MEDEAKRCCARPSLESAQRKDQEKQDDRDKQGDTRTTTRRRTAAAAEMPQVSNISDALGMVSLQKKQRPKAVSFSICGERKRARTISWGEDDCVLLDAVASESIAPQDSHALGFQSRIRPKAVSFSFDESMLSMNEHSRSFFGCTDSVHSMTGDLRMTPLMQAARDGNTGLVKVLLDAGADPGYTDKRGYDALMYAVRDGYAKVCALLLEAIRARVGRQGQTGYSFHNKHRLSHMLYAAHNGHTSCVTILAKFGSKLNMGDSSACTPLMAAVQNNHINTAQELLRLGASIDLQDRRGLTALHWAVRCGLFEMVELLLKYNPNLEIGDIADRTPLFYAVCQGHSEIGELLLARGARVCDRVRAAVVRMHIEKTEVTKQNVTKLKSDRNDIAPSLALGSGKSGDDSTSDDDSQNCNDSHANIVCSA